MAKKNLKKSKRLSSVKTTATVPAVQKIRE